MNDSHRPLRHRPTTDLSAGAVVLGYALVASVPLALWALENPLVAVVLAATGSLAVAFTRRSLKSDG